MSAMQARVMTGHAHEGRYVEVDLAAVGSVAKARHDHEEGGAEEIGVETAHHCPL